MADVIYKYGPFDIRNIVEYAGEPVHVGYQDQSYSPHPDHRIYMWCRLSDDSPCGKAKIVATGEHYTGRYIGTVVMPSSMVWHVVEVQ
jgi:hypothetical protein